MHSIEHEHEFVRNVKVSNNAGKEINFFPSRDVQIYMLIINSSINLQLSVSLRGFCTSIVVCSCWNHYFLLFSLIINRMPCLHPKYCRCFTQRNSKASKGNENEIKWIIRIFLLLDLVLKIRYPSFLTEKTKRSLLPTQWTKPHLSNLLYLNPVD